MSKKLKLAFLEFLKAYDRGKCAPDDWSFNEQASTAKLISALKADLKIEEDEE